MRYAILMCAAMMLCMVCSRAFAGMHPVKGFEERQPSTHNANPWGLVYADAIAENVKGKVNIRPIAYALNGIEVAANVYTPAGYDPSKQYPAVTVAHPNGGVKELYGLRGRKGRIGRGKHGGTVSGDGRHEDRGRDRLPPVRGLQQADLSGEQGLLRRRYAGNPAPHMVRQHPPRADRRGGELFLGAGRIRPTDFLQDLFRRGDPVGPAEGWLDRAAGFWERQLH